VQQRTIEMVDHTSTAHVLTIDAAADGRPRAGTPRSAARRSSLRHSSSAKALQKLCEVHPGSGRLVVRREGDRLVLDAHADECCVLALEDVAVTRLFNVLGKWRG
jgi:hypothetical protein